MKNAVVLDRLLDPLAECLTPDAAKRIVEFRADPATQVHLDQLANKSTEGTLTAAERAEYEDFVDAIQLIGILQSKARRVLKRTG